MKKIILIFLIMPFFTIAQRWRAKDFTTILLDSIQYNISPKTLAPSQIDLPFKSIEILDARFDTSKLGFEIHREYSQLRLIDFKRIKLEGGVNQSLQNFYNDYYKIAFKNSTNKLFIVLKTLWINNLPSKQFQEKIRYDLDKESFQNIYVKLEYYLNNGTEYIPLKRVDTVYQLTEPILLSQENIIS